MLFRSVGNACSPDKDGDGAANALDNCPRAPNTDQADLDADGLGDECDADKDGDGFLDMGADANDECPLSDLCH